MKSRSLVAALLLALPLSTFGAACDRGEDRDDSRAALEREALQRDLDLALEADTTVQPELADVPVEAPPVESVASPAPAPAPPRTAGVPEPRRVPERREPPPQSHEPEPAPEEVLPAEPEAPRAVTRTAPAGTSFGVRLDRALSTRDARVGDTFTATLDEPLVASDGTTLIPAGATVHGRVTEAQASGGAGQRARIAVTFTSISHGGETYPIEGTVTSAPPARLVTRDSRTEQAAKVAGGAAIGGVVGRVLGRDTRSTVIGAAVGAAAGTAVAITTAEVDAVLPESSMATVRLDSPVRVRRE
ncbi:MAG TPA: hypothetical protein VHG28_07790 [Longimicrobiaceae bacterium]|nr:hypothetical protein [Longimicrobiaceae bacterium]